MLRTNNEKNILEHYDLHIKKKNNKCWEWWTDDVSDFQSHFTWLFFPSKCRSWECKGRYCITCIPKNQALSAKPIYKEMTLTHQPKEYTGTLAKGGGCVIRFCIWPTTNNKLVLFASFWDVPKNRACCQVFPSLTKRVRVGSSSPVGLLLTRRNLSVPGGLGVIERSFSYLLVPGRRPKILYFPFLRTYDGQNKKEIAYR